MSSIYVTLPPAASASPHCAASSRIERGGRTSRPRAPNLSAGLRALALGLGAFGVNWVLFMAFVSMVYPDAFVDSTLRVCVDILLVVFICLAVQGRQVQEPDDRT